MTIENTFERLQAPFQVDDVGWRVQQAGISNNTPWAIVVAYVTNRAIQQRLDEVMKPSGWRNCYEETPGGFKCGLSLKIDGEWITKWDGANHTTVEPIKGGLSDAMKRAAVQWGIGRYLYHLDQSFAKCRVIASHYEAGENVHRHVDKSNNQVTLIDWDTPELPQWALPIEGTPFLEAIDNAETLIELRCAFQEAYKFARANNSSVWTDKFTEAKDTRKKALEAETEEKADEHYKSVESWLEGQCEYMSTLSNSSSVNTLYKSLAKALDARCEGEAFDPAPLKKLLKTACDSRIESLNSPKDTPLEEEQ